MFDLIFTRDVKTYQIVVKYFGNLIETVVETKRRDNVTLRRGGDVPQPRYWVFHLEVIGDAL